MADGPTPVTPQKNAQITVEFEQKNLSVGTARYTGAKALGRNLSLKPSGVRGQPPGAMVHANVEVRLRDAQGREVPMTRRLVRHWYMRPLPGATVEQLNKWQVVGLAPSEFLPFASSGGEPPSELSFFWDRPGARDAPGFQEVTDKPEPFGQLQEFLAGNAAVGGAYYQVYTMRDARNIRVMTSQALTLSAEEYREVLRQIDSGQYPKQMSAKLFFMPSIGSSTVQALP